MLFVPHPASPRPPLRHRYLRCGRGFPAYRQLPISSPCLSLFLCLRVPQHLVKFAWLQNWEEVNCPGTIFNQWGMRVMEQYPPASGSSLETVLRCILQGFSECLQWDWAHPVHCSNPSLMHMLLTYFSSLSHFPYSLISASQDHLPNKLHNPSPCPRAYLWEN